MTNILVLGGSGVLGSAMVALLQQQGVSFLTGSRSQIKSGSYSTVNQSTTVPWKYVDLVSGNGIREALQGIDTVFHLASGQGKIGSDPFEMVLTRNLLKALHQSDVTHLVYSSIVGINKIPTPYYQAKLESERLISESGLPYTILRISQFHNLIDFFLTKLLRFPIGFIPGSVLAQPIQVNAAASALLAVAQRAPQQSTLNIGGPEVLDLATMARAWLTYREASKLILPIPAFNTLLKGFAKGYNTCSEMATGSPTWDDYLRASYGTSKQ